MPEFRSVQLPAQLCSQAENRYGARFGSLEEFLTSLLQEVLRDDAAKLEQAEEQIIEERLRQLGYI
jgi:hypothetical protein